MISEIWRVFRYRDISQPHFISEIRNTQIFCGPPDNLNDPFDCRVDWRKSFDRTIARGDLPTARRRILEDIKRQFEERAPPSNTGVCCFTIKADDQLMWAHYAGNHRGVCLLYEIPVQYLQDQYPSEAGDFFFVGGSKIHYDDNAFSNWLRLGNLFEPTNDPAENAVTRIFTSKSKAWEHEEEYRLVMSKPGLVQLQPQHLTEITFGLRTPKESQVQIGTLARATNPNIVVGQVTKSKYLDFGLNFPNHDQ